MSDDQTDVRAVRELMLGRASSSPEVVGRLRDRVVAQRPGVARARRRWLVPIAAAATALAVVAAVAVAFEGATGPSAPWPGAPAVPPGVAVQGPVLDTVRTFADLRLAAAQSPPVTIPPGSLLYFRQDTLMFNLPAGAVPDGAAEQWIDPQGMITLRERVGGKTPTAVESLAERRSDFAKAGPGYFFPTPAWLAGLPTDAGALDSLLRSADPTLKSTALFVVYAALFRKLDPLLPVGVRTALLDLLMAIPGISVSAVTIDGTALDAVRWYSGNVPEELFFDPATAHAVGTASFQTPGTPSPGVSPRPITSLDVNGDGLIRAYQSRWTYSVVAGLPR